VFRKTLSFILVGLVLSLAFYSTASANTGKNPELEAKVKAGISNWNSNERQSEVAR
jgi:ABC-type proline/glycine betaine transport system substrate-binding protein